MMSSVIMNGGFSPIAVAADVTVSGKRVSESVRVEGIFLIQTDEDGYFEVKPLELKINGETRGV